MSPIEGILCAAVSALCGVIAWLYRSQEAARAAAHAETREKIDELEGHIEDCNKDRTTFREQLAVLTERQSYIDRCAHVDCPVRRNK